MVDSFSKNQPLRISIVTPSYNQGEFLEECIDSVLSQNYPDLEYVIMDGGSTDNSVDIIRKYEKYLTYWQSQPDGGQYAAVRDGFRRTSGEIMAWLNSDDRYHVNAFFAVAYLFAANQDVQWLTGRPTWWGRNGEVTKISESLPLFRRSQFLEKEYLNPSIQQESTFWRRSLWERAGGYVRADLDYAGDLELWIRFFRFADLHTADALLGGYRSYGQQKVAYALDKYIAEADGVIEEEIRRMTAEGDTKLNLPPEPLGIDPRTLVAYFSLLAIPCGAFNQLCRYYQNMLSAADRDRLVLTERVASLEAQLDACAESNRTSMERLSAVESSLGWRLVQFYGRQVTRFRKLLSL